MASLDEKVIDVLEVAGTALARYEKIAEAKQEAEKRASAVIPAVVDTLVTHGWIGADEKTAAATALADHARTLELLQRQAAAPKQASDVPAMGEPTARNKRASADYSPSRYTGRTQTEDPESWKRFEERLFGN